MLLLNFLILILMIAITAFFVASEFSLVKIRVSRLEQLKKEGVKNADLALQVTENLDAYLSASQLGITLAGLIIGWVGEGSVAVVLKPILNDIPMIATFTHTISIVLGFMIVTYIDVVVGELLPKSYSIAQTEKVVLTIVKPLYYFYKVMYPFIWLLNHSAIFLGRIFGMKLASENEEVLTQEELLYVAVDSYKNGELTKEEYQYLENVFEFDDTLAKEIQVDRTSMDVLAFDVTVKQAIHICLQKGHTRYPVIEESKDKVLGYVTLPLLVEAMLTGKEITVDQLVEEPIVVLATMPIKQLLNLMRQMRKHIAILKDEYGGTTGIVTIEDILEELVGDIQDETDKENALIQKKAKNQYIVSGKMTLDDFERYFKVKIPIFADSQKSTLTGFIVQEYEKQIYIGKQIIIDTFLFEVLDYEKAYINYFKIVKKS